MPSEAETSPVVGRAPSGIAASRSTGETPPVASTPTRTEASPERAVARTSTPVDGAPPNMAPERAAAAPVALATRRQADPATAGDLPPFGARLPGRSTVWLRRSSRAGTLGADGERPGDSGARGAGTGSSPQAGAAPRSIARRFSSAAAVGSSEPHPHAQPHLQLQPQTAGGTNQAAARPAASTTDAGRLAAVTGGSLIEGPDGRASVTFAPGGQPLGGSARGIRTATAQRALPEPASATAAIDVDDLYDQIAARLRRELLLDRERAGELP
jgi:hypothetical protein